MKGKVVLIVSVIFLILFMIMLYSVPEAKDWSDSFSQSSKKPYGSKLIKDNILSVFPEQEVEKVDQTVYEKLLIYNYNSGGYQPESENNYNRSRETEQIIEEDLNGESEYNSEETEGISDPYESSEDGIAEENTNEYNSESTQEETNEYGTEGEETNEEYNSEEYVNNPSIQDKKIELNTSNYLFVNSKLEFDETDVNMLLNYVRKGNQVFMAANFFSGKLADTFHLKTQNTYLKDSLISDDFISKERAVIRFKFSNRNFKAPREYAMKGLSFGSSFKSVDSVRSEILAVNGKHEPVFIRIKYGDGYFYISSTPHAYTNYAFANQQMADYCAASLSYLPIQKTYWDEYYKVGRVTNRDSMDFVSRNVSLRWTWRLVLIGLLLYMIFESKRYQRLIPIYKKLQNSTVEFVYTMGRLYMQKGDHKDLATKKIQYFMEYIRQSFFLPTHEVNEEFLVRLSQRSGVARKDIENLFAQIAYVQRSGSCGREELISLSANIDQFKNKSKLR